MARIGIGDDHNPKDPEHPLGWMKMRVATTPWAEAHDAWVEVKQVTVVEDCPAIPGTCRLDIANADKLHVEGTADQVTRRISAFLNGALERE